MASSTRRLTDLFVVGKEVSFDDGAGDPITVFVRKLNAAEHDKALRRANGERSKILAAKKDEESELHGEQKLLLLDFTANDLIEYLGEDERQRKSSAIEAELAAEEEWATDDYLAGLRAAWADGLMEKWTTTPEDEEGKRVYLELKRFAEQAAAAVDGHVEAFTRDLATVNEETLRERCFNKLMEVQASLAWLGEFRHCELWLAVREEDRHSFYFQDRSEVEQLPNEVLNELAAVYREISVDPVEGKALRQTATS